MIKRITNKDNYIHKCDVERFGIHDENKQIIHTCLFNHPVNVYDEPWMWHLHLKTTDVCNAKCEFCVEKVHRNDSYDEDLFLKNTDLMLKEMSGSNILWSVSVTGGEPTLFKKFDDLCNILSKYDVKFLTMNTNGVFLDKYIDRIDSMFDFVDISRHGFSDAENDEIFKTTVPTISDLKALKSKMRHCKMRIQAVTKYINTVDEMNRFVDLYSFADDISFRRLMKLSKEYGHTYSVNDDYYNDLIEYAFNNWEFKEQTIQDYYVYEIYNNGFTDITFSYSDMEMLRKYEKNEANFYREFIIHPNGCVTGSWQKDNRILLEGV